ncbi:MAG: energy-coupling factor transporter transmembrane component T [Candidatus Nanopelagicales bacterium]|nr:energy-coupling factor transporter transmembrane component T [Candidatus Nanopelagicales bacterium]
MSLAFGAGVETSGVWSAVGRINPVSKLAITVVITVGLLLSLHPVTVGGILILELAALPFVGLRLASVAARVAFVLVPALLLTLVNALFSGHTGGSWSWDWGPFALSPEGLQAAAPVGMRLLALSLPAVLLLSTTDPVLMADSVQQHLRVPARYALALLVGLRLLPLLAAQWTELSAARRARGLSARGPISAGRAVAGRTVGLLVEALRRAVRMATAMQARGFDPYAPRTFARPSRFGVGDAVAIVVSVVAVSALGLLGMLT